MHGHERICDQNGYSWIDCFVFVRFDLFYSNFHWQYKMLEYESFYLMKLGWFLGCFYFGLAYVGLVRTFIIKSNNESNEIYYEIITFYDVFCTIQDQNIRSIHKQRILSFKSCYNKFVHFMTARAHLVALNQYNAIVLMYDSIWLLWNQCDVFFKRFHHTFGDIIHWIYQIRSRLVCVVFKREYTKHNAYITYINGSKERFFDY